MEEIVMESDSVELSEPAPQLSVGDAWETVTSALVSGLYHRTLS